MEPVSAARVVDCFVARCHERQVGLEQIIPFPFDAYGLTAVDYAKDAGMEDRHFRGSYDKRYENHAKTRDAEAGSVYYLPVRTKSPYWSCSLSNTR